jgi:hypothetical protein
VAGPTALPLVQDVVDPRIRWRPEGLRTLAALSPVTEAAGVVQVHADGRGSWRDPGPALPFLGGSGRVVAVVADVGEGRVVALADASPLHNRHLDEADDAALALGTAGEPGRRVVFEEAVHGYGSGGASVLPANWSRALLTATIAVLLLMWTAARRLGPPEQPDRELPPARRQYVDALAVSLSRTGEPAAALAHLQRRARSDLALRLGLAADAGRAEVLAAARRVGIPEHDVAALFDAPGGADEVIAVGRAAARQRGGRSD